MSIGFWVVTNIQFYDAFYEILGFFYVYEKVLTKKSLVKERDVFLTYSINSIILHTFLEK